MHFSKRCSFCCVLFPLFLLFSNCGNAPTETTEESSGLVVVRTVINPTGLGKTAAVMQTTFDSLIVEITGDDISPIRRGRKIDMMRPTIVDTVGGIPPGTVRYIKVWTVNREGQMVHLDTEEYRQVRIERGLATPVDVVLIPALGSIYLQLTSIPTDVDSLFVTFTSIESDSVWEKRLRRALKVYVTLDNIPHGTEGVLCVLAVGETDTLFFFEEELRVDARMLDETALQFLPASGSLEVSAEIELPGAHLVSASFGSDASLQEETGKLIITEIMYSATNYEYLELLNPSEDTLFFDTLLVELDGTARSYTDITIYPQAYFVIGRNEMPWADIWHESASALNLVSTGNQIAIREPDGSVLDRVVFSPGSAGLEWPVVSGRRALELNRDFYNVEANNFGRYWFASTEQIEDSDMFGTPGY